LEAAEKLAAEQPARALERVRRACRLTVECLQEVRRSVCALRASSVEELSLPRALSRLGKEFAQNTGLNVNVDIRCSEDQRFPPEVAMALYRRPRRA
jgi:signal transduction histidine kinase